MVSAHGGVRIGRSARLMAERILVIDDDEGLRESLQLVLSAEGYEVGGAEDSRAALGILENSSFDVILCDLRMRLAVRPVFNGRS